MKQVDIIDVMAEMNADETFCFTTIYHLVRDDYSFSKATHNGKNVCEFNYIQKISFGSDLNSKKKFMRGFKSLNDKNIVCRTSRGHYMISPFILIDTNGFQEKHEDIWLSLHPQISILTHAHDYTTQSLSNESRLAIKH